MRGRHLRGLFVSTPEKGGTCFPKNNHQLTQLLSRDLLFQIRDGQRMWFNSWDNTPCSRYEKQCKGNDRSLTGILFGICFLNAGYGICVKTIVYYGSYCILQKHPSNIQQGSRMFHEVHGKSECFLSQQILMILLATTIIW